MTGKNGITAVFAVTRKRLIFVTRIDQINGGGRGICKAMKRNWV
jgi:hypothetical protein